MPASRKYQHSWAPRARRAYLRNLAYIAGDDLHYSCKCRRVCPSCTTRRMVETAAHLAEHVIPRLPVRQWVLSVPKRLRHHLERDPAVLNAALHIFLSAIERVLRQHSSGAGAASRLAALVFIHRFRALLNTHLHFHCIVVDGTFDTDAAAENGLDHASGGGLPDLARAVPAGPNCKPERGVVAAIRRLARVRY